jgi:hypothetical protein
MMLGHYTDKTANVAINEVGGARTDCFAYRKDYLMAECIALRDLYCKREKCKFYKSKIEYKKQLEKAKERMKELYGKISEL